MRCTRKARMASHTYSGPPSSPAGARGRSMCGRRQEQRHRTIGRALLAATDALCGTLHNGVACSYKPISAAACGTFLLQHLHVPPYTALASHLCHTHLRTDTSTHRSFEPYCRHTLHLRMM
jgi:hypothetical protein